MVSLDLSVIKCVVYDFDDTLVKTSILHENAFRETFRTCGISINFRYNEVAGLSTEVAIKKLVTEGHLSLSTAEFRKMVELKQTIFNDYVSKSNINISFGAIEAFEYFRGVEIPQYILSNAASARLNFCVDRLNIGKYLDGVFSSSDITPLKPDSGCYRRFSEKTNQPLEGTLVVDDCDYCRASASAVGCLTNTPNEFFGFFCE